MKIRLFISVCSVLCMVSTSWAQDTLGVSKRDGALLMHIKESRENRLRSEMFISTEWMPDLGIKLLGDRSTYKTWTDFADDEKCKIPHLDLSKKSDDDVVASFALFQTDKLNLFVFEYHMSDQVGVHWVICNRSNKKQLFESYSGTPIELYFDSTSPTDEIFGGCPSPVSKVRFRKYTKEGPLLLEVLSQRCQCEPNYHETLFHIDTEFKEVPGARVDMDYEKHPERSWRWWYYGKSYKPRSLTFNENGDATWTRKLYKLPYKSNVRYAPEYTFSALIEKTCTYNSAKREVVCSQKELKR